MRVQLIEDGIYGKAGEFVDMGTVKAKAMGLDRPEATEPEAKEPKTANDSKKNKAILN